MTASNLEQLYEQAIQPRHAPTMGVLAKIRYSHQDMIDYLITNPHATQNELARRYGYSVGWVSNVMASDAWKSAFAARRGAMTDDVVIASVKERFEGMTLLSLQRLQEKLEAPVVSDNVVLKAVELGAKAMGIGGNAAPPPAAPSNRLEQLAERLISLQSNIRGQVYENEKPAVGIQVVEANEPGKN